MTEYDLDRVCDKIYSSKRKICCYRNTIERLGSDLDIYDEVRVGHLHRALNDELNNIHQLELRKKELLLKISKLEVFVND